jgi:hypothetical protein
LISLPTVMEKLMVGQWAEVYRDHGISKE